MRTTLLGFVILAGLFFASRTAADATLRVCNGSNDPVTVAIAAITLSNGGTQIQSEGWFQIDTQTCTNVIDTDLDPTTLYYLYAKATLELWAGSPRKGTRDAQFCTNFAGRFSYVDVPNNLCTGAGQEMLWFINEPINGPTWTINLNNP